MIQLQIWVIVLVWLIGAGTGAVSLAIAQQHTKYRRCQNCDWPILRRQFHEHAKECIS